MSWLDQLAASPVFEPLDLHFARLLQRLEPDGVGIVALTGALLSLERARGNSCIDLNHWASRPLIVEPHGTSERLPDLETWERALDASPLVSDGAVPTPLVQRPGRRLYMRRYWHAEQRLARRLLQRLEVERRSNEDEAIKRLFRQLFPNDPETPDWQAVAAALALFSPLVCISGGPGTGKTTTVAGILALLLTQDPDLRIALAAPTGKAAARLSEAIASKLETLEVDEKARSRVPLTASTLHRLLGYHPRKDRFRHHEARPIAADVVILDEASMVDILLFEALIAALPAGCRLLLLGDKHQLASIDAGFVFGDLCGAAAEGGLSRPFVDLFRSLSSHELEISDPPSLLSDTYVELVKSYRFSSGHPIADLADAVLGGRAEEALAVLATPNNVRQIVPETIEEALTPMLDSIDAYLASGTPAEALQELGRFRVLAARREGAWGLAPLNAAIERHLARAGHPISDGFYPARPILVTANDYTLQLFNGDLGICWPDGGRLWAWFTGDGELRRIPLAKLPPHETAWAMTIHKSQGSEFDRVLLVLGDTDSRVLSRELFYTGLTRARQEVHVVASSEIVRAAIERPTRRVSGLVGALRDGSRKRLALQAPDITVRTTENPEKPARSDDKTQLELF